MRAITRRRRRPHDLGDRAMLGVARSIHRAADAWFGCRRTHRMLVLEALAGIPGTVFALLRHLRSLRRMRDDPMVRRALVQADHEQAHLLVFSALVTPTPIERVILGAGQALFLAGFLALAVLSERLAQRLAAYFEEEALESYDDYARALDRGEVENAPVPRWAVARWHLVDGARLADLVPAIEIEEADHRDEHHVAADALVEATRRPVDAPSDRETRSAS